MQDIQGVGVWGLSWFPGISNGRISNIRHKQFYDHHEYEQFYDHSSPKT